MDKYIDKLLDTRWFMKVVALILALLLFISVYDPDEGNSDVNVPGEQDTEVLSDIPVKSYYDTDNFIVSGVPGTVNITMKGPKSLILQAKAQRNFEVYVDLSNAKIGTKKVPIKIRDISDKIQVKIEPKYANVNVQEKITKEFDVQVEFNHSQIESGYIAGEPETDPKKIEITAAKDIVEQIRYVKAAVNVQGSIRDTVRREARIMVLDGDMNKLEAMPEQETVKVTIPIKSLSKTVPIKIIEKGDPPKDVKIDSISIDHEEVKIYGSQELLNKTDSVRVEVDVSRITKDTEVTLPIIIPEEMRTVEPQTVKAKIIIEESKEDIGKAEDEEADENKTFTNLPITVSGLSDQYEANIENPSNGTSLTVTGESSVINELKPSDFQLFLDLADLGEGEHEVEINVDGPADVDWQLGAGSAKIYITQKEEI